MLFVIDVNIGFLYNCGWDRIKGSFEATISKNKIPKEPLFKNWIILLSQQNFRLNRSYYIIHLSLYTEIIYGARRTIKGTMEGGSQAT